MRISSFLLMAILFSSAALAQNSTKRTVSEKDIPDYVRGEIYFKVDPKSEVELSSFHRGKDEDSVLESAPEIQELLDPYEVQRIHCPFRTQATTIQHTFKLHFERNGEKATQTLLEELASISYVDYAERVPMYRTFFTPNDVAVQQQWYLDSIAAFDAWDAAQGGSPDVEIAVVDNAVHSSHPDLQADIAINEDEVAGDSVDNDNNGYVDDVKGWDAADQDNDPEPPESHPL